MAGAVDGEKLNSPPELTPDMPVFALPLAFVPPAAVPVFALPETRGPVFADERGADVPADDFFFFCEDSSCEAVSLLIAGRGANDSAATATRAVMAENRTDMSLSILMKWVKR